MKRVYMYPMKEIHELRGKHPYQYNLVTQLAQYFSVSNYGRKPRRGIKDVSAYFFKSDIFYYNWVENLSRKTEVFYFVFFFIAAKLFGKKNVWAHHNVHPHHGDTALSRWLISFLSKYSDYIVIHTKESYKHLKLKESSKRVLFFFHPFFSNIPNQSAPPVIKEYDLLIWGNMRGSKGVQKFLEFLKEGKKLDKYRIKVIGKFESEDSFNMFKQNFSGKWLSVENKYADENELNALHANARFVFFPYTGSSVLNSGALISSIPRGTRIIGPNSGAFKDLGEAGLIYTYQNFSDVTNIVDVNDELDSHYHQAIAELCQKFSWENFGSFLGKNLV